MTDLTVPNSLKKWFVIHFIIDIIFAIPMFLFPEEFLNLLEWQSIDPLTTRLVGAALFAIGIESYMARNASASSYKNMLNLKLIWSGAAIIGIIITIFQFGEYSIVAVWLLLITFLGFHLLWWYWRTRIGRILASES